MKNLLTGAIASTILASSAQASVTLAFEFLSLRDSLGTELSDGSTVAIFADTSGNLTGPSGSSFLDETLTIGNSYDGDELLALGSTTTDAGDAGYFFLGSASYDSGNNINAGTLFTVVWFDTTSTTISSGTDYGLYSNTNSAESEAGFAMVRPGDGGSANIAYYDSNFGGSATVADFTADMTVAAVPEPSSTALLGLGCVGFILRRRR
ncbi:PEP-CTERM sorting domain-containing protein [Rubritalea marina]|uniref:PEP-CTERM sorting domain-containing protein n=1 Tax=Rubritalea marina TaxID=361055 RepID=UPI0003807EA3|nr:PEP-CTERM sorting domain-containing protein [Rubritalea marina]